MLLNFYYAMLRVVYATVIDDASTTDDWLISISFGPIDVVVAGAGSKPILLKIAPDLTNEQLLDIIDIVNVTKIDGVIATNTTISRDNLKSENKTEVGGLSGKPLANRSTEVIRFLSEKSNKAFPIIGVGGIHSADDAIEKLNAGASLIQLYTGFIYEGPGLIKEINQKILSREYGVWSKG